MCHSAIMDTINIVRVLEMAEQANMSYGLIAEDQKVDRTVIKLFMKSRGIKIKHSSKRLRSAHRVSEKLELVDFCNLAKKPMPRSKSQAKSIDIVKVRDLATVKGMSFRRIAEASRVSLGFIIKFMKENDIHMDDPCMQSDFMRSKAASARVSIASLVNQ